MTDSTKRAACCQRGVGQGSIQILAKGDTSAARDVEIKSIPVAYFLSSDGSLARRMALGLQRNENTVKRFRYLGVFLRRKGIEELPVYSMNLNK